MLTQLHKEREMKSATISTLADEVVFTLGNYRRDKPIDEKMINWGIEFCEAIIRGKKVNDEEMTLEQMPDYTKYRVIKNKSDRLTLRDVDLNALLQKVPEIISILEDIRSKRGKVENEKIEETQKFFIDISLPFWEEKLSSFRQRKISRSLHIG